MTKERLDKILTDKGFFETKSKAQAAIMAGDVKVDGIVITKAGYQIEPKDNTVFEIKSMPFVSRGGFKLDKAMKTFGINIKDKICLDAGASTGGFTDCMLQYGAKKVYSVDVGYGQISWKLRTDSRVKVIERVNIKSCNLEDIYDDGDEKAQFITMDLSFISIKKVIENIIKLASKDGFEIVSLIKPQFEAGKTQVGKNGVVREKEIHVEVINDIIKFCENINLFVKDLTYSPIKGPKGNIEYLIYLTNTPCYTDINPETIADKAHNELID
ncbi:MAG: TlyA family RNA methyltransferase [Candidatus Gastranaerophilales bacterium]|nr:TlyA family RNA methyltransferase [Candidatus Gastranaerophilales bacterium]